ncbi:MAG: hypothetical protein ACKVG4_16125 [Longimicrobiales bacterium]
MIRLTKYVQAPLQRSSEWDQVSRIADDLHAFLNKPSTLAAIETANQPGESSASIQETFLDFASNLGFESEKKGLFADLNLALRPDYYRALDESGILLEVERGKTTINNMDLLDFWKCHLCPGANYLFLLVPQALRQNPAMKPRDEFATVERRLAQFFVEGSFTNVRGLCLFGY